MSVIGTIKNLLRSRQLTETELGLRAEAEGGREQAQREAAAIRDQARRDASDMLAREFPPFG